VTSTMSNADEIARKSAALEHVRAFHLWAADLRVKNFGFFILIAGAMTGATVKLLEQFDLTPMFIMGVAAGVLFFIIDVRTMELIKDARLEEYSLESYFGVGLHTADKLQDKKRGVSASGRNRLASHTFVYRLTYLGTSMISIAFLTGLIG
jgi:hypothetical protein